MMKKIGYIFMAVCVCFIFTSAVHVSAQTDCVYDYADLLSEEEEESLREYAKKMSDVWEMNVLAVTTEDAQGQTSAEYADDFYDTKFPEEAEEDGVLYLIDMDNREIYLFTSGIVIRYLTDDRIERILDTAYGYVEEGDYYGTFQSFFDESESYLYEDIPEDQYNYDTETGEIDYYEEPMGITFGEILFALLVALIPALITVFTIKGTYQLKFEDFHYGADTDSDVKLSVRSDVLINRFVTHRKIPKDTGNTGRSSGSRSSVHRSSSGRSHGGGGRKF